MPLVTATEINVQAVVIQPSYKMVQKNKTVLRNSKGTPQTSDLTL
jgi:hypothetical protein